MARNFGMPPLRLRVVRFDVDDGFPPEPDLTWPRVLVWGVPLAVMALTCAWWFH